MRRPDGVTLIAIYHIIIGLPFLIGACAILGVPISGALAGTDRVGLFWSTFGLGIGFLFTAGGGLLSILTGWGLIGLKGWARWIAIVLAVLALPLFPVGTLIGGLILWYLFQENVRVLFEGQAAPASVEEPEE
jgi:hypothetical protein